MREIKFRAWNTDSKEMVYELRLQKENDDLNETFRRYGGLVMQYTGLKDKNNKEIYEGDIVTIEGLQDVQEVKWDERFYCWGFEPSDNMLDIGGDIEVIGNIYENPELLNEAK